jgi:Protein of unknown function (DUF998)
MVIVGLKRREPSGSLERRLDTSTRFDVPSTSTQARGKTMTQSFSTPRAGAPSASTATDTNRTRALLACGVAAGPLFIVVALLQVLTRDGFDLSRHPLSLLSLGDLGWIQIGNFVVTGLLAVAFAVGLRRVLHPGRGGTWGPLLLGAFGVGLIAGGVFVPDPALGFPPGAPSGILDQFSWHALLHAIAPPLAFSSLIVACFVVARRFAGLRQRGWAAYCAATGVAVLALSAWPDLDVVSVVLAAAAALGLGWVSVLAARLLAELADQSGGSQARIR